MKKRVSQALLVAAALSIIGTARAEWPERPIRVIVPYTPGVGGDVMIRWISEDLAKQLGQPVIVENRDGAAGNIGTLAVSRALADGYTFLVAATPNYVVNHLLYRSFNIEPLKAFSPVMIMGKTPSVLFTNLDVPANDFNAFLAYAKERKGQLNYGTPGVGTPVYLAFETLNRSYGLGMIAASYRGAVPVLTGVVSGELHLGFALQGPAQQYIKAGRVRPLAVLANERLASMPDTPSFRELGLPVFETWWAMSAPAGTPEPILNRMNAAMRQSLLSTEIGKRLEEAGIVPVASTREQAVEIMSREAVSWARTIKDLAIPRVE